ncbi:MAG: single-stranded-DNA-specific exonuclease RecJ [Gammaproteobacteria bacterium]|nr:single-stranded-DNA-specific exonuclease RecJ [Gammaproteobacteria bacterium]
MDLQKKQIIRRNIATEHKLPDDLHPTLQRIYAARDLLRPEEMDYSIGKMLPPDLLAGMDQAVSLLVTALEEKQHIVIVADYDADGATSCALAVRGLQKLGAHQVSYLVPNRFDYGYGLTPEIVQLALPLSPDLLVTVDNGISSIEGVKAAHQCGISVLVTDHHLSGPQLPEADAIVNPNQSGDSFPSKALAGVGVIFYVLLALRSQLRKNNWFALQKINEPNLAQLLDLVALGTVADLVPLDHNNRILVARGLERINRKQCCPGITALAEVAGKTSASLSATDLGFFLAPRINAAGRLQDMSLGIACLLTDDATEAMAMARRLDQINIERRAIQDDMQNQANLIIDQLVIEDKELPPALCLYDKNWHQGVIGLVASRVKEKLHRPVIAFAPGGGNTIKGSARSIPGLHIRDLLDNVAARHPDILRKFGGHAMAAGLTLQHEHLQRFESLFREEVEKVATKEILQHNLVSDGELALSDFHLDFAESLQKAGPWGQGFPEPVFDGQFDVIEQRIVGENHLKMVLRPCSENPTETRHIDAIAFNYANKLSAAELASVRAAFRLDVNEFKGRRSLQAIINYMEPADKTPA